MGKARMVSVQFYVAREVDDFFEDVRKQLVEVAGRKVRLDKSRSEIYRQAVEFAVKHAEEWLVKGD